jgi:hypothetical protein
MGQPVKPADPVRGSFSRYEAWHFLLFEAAWKIKEIDNKGRVVRLRRGELMAAAAWLAHSWNWTAETVRWFLVRLEREGMVKSVDPIVLTPSAPQAKPQANGVDNPKRRVNTMKVLSICNYEIYQTVYELEKLMNPKQNENKPQALPQQINKNNITITRGREIADVKQFNIEIANAVGPALCDPNFYGSLADTRIAQGWIHQGCDMVIDVLPTLRRLGAGQAKNSIRTWKYFNDAVLTARDQRLKPTPTRKAQPPSANDDLERKKRELRALGANV